MQEDIEDELLTQLELTLQIKVQCFVDYFRSTLKNEHLSTFSAHHTKTSAHGDTLILNYAIADVLQNKMQSKSKSKKKLSDLQQKYVEWTRQMDKITQSL